MTKAFHLDDLAWEPVRPALTSGVFGRTMLDTGTKMVFTRVEPGGEFAPHVDPYAHLFYVLSGCGIALSAGSEYQLTPGLVLQIPAGEKHSYRNTGAELLVLISLNLPA
jgi:quercetin dioxygenase-like cupin family protein